MIWLIKFFFLILVCVSSACFSVVSADQNDARLDDLFQRLAATDDAAQAGTIEAQVWEIWIESGRADIDTLMQQGIAAMATQNLDDALQLFDRVVALAPDFSEGWNKRATVNYLRAEYDASVRDIQRTLALEPRHFGALSGMGLIFLQVGDDEGALQAFEDVLRLYPGSVSAQFYIEQLRARLDDKII